MKQVAAVLFSSAWALVFTLGMLWVIDRITAVRVEGSEEQAGLDESLHGEAAYIESV
jgi:Amt family ammonium transporter